MSETTEQGDLMKDWGPADWYVVVSVAFAVLCIVVSILFMWLDELPETLREMLSKRPSSDPRNLVPYRRPDDPDEDF